MLNQGNCMKARERVEEGKRQGERGEKGNTRVKLGKMHGMVSCQLVQ